MFSSIQMVTRIQQPSEYQTIEMVDLCPVVKCSSIQMVLKNGLKKPVYGTKCLAFKWSAKSYHFIILILETRTVWYSDQSGIQVFGVQMETE